MTFEIFLSVCSLIFLIILIMTYYSKSLLKSTKSILFRMMLITGIVFTVSELVCILVYKYTGIYILYLIPWRIHLATCILFWAIFFFYSLVVISSLKTDSFKSLLKYNLLTKIYSIIGAICIIFLLFMPHIGNIDKIDLNDLCFMPKFILIFALLFFVFIGTNIIIMMIKYKKKYDNKYKVILITTSIISVVFIILQTRFKYIAWLPFGYTLILYLLYFIKENPDLEIIEEINSAQGNIEKSSQTKTDFLSNMTFEIKTPMNLIIGLCDDMMNMSEFNEEEIRKSIKQVSDSGYNLLDIINNILDISKLENGNEILHEKEYKINDLISNIVVLTEQKIGSKPVKVVTNIDQTTSSVLSGDSSKLYQALINIVSNAAKYTDVGKITITLTSSKQNDNENLLFKVTDTGSGIKDEDKGKLFSKGTRLENATTTEVDGSGFGLVIAKQYVEALGGKIWFESEYRAGSTFYIEVTQKIIDATPIGDIKVDETNNKNEKLDCSKYRILLVDDNELNIRVIRRLLYTYKFNIDSVNTAKDCINKIKQEEHYDLIFMDHMMPDMDGIEALHILKHLEGYTLPPIIALTANAIAGMREMYLNEGFDGYISKPINTHELDMLINSCFKK